VFVTATVAVVIPCYRVRKHILGVLAAIGPDVSAVYVVDDGCPEGTGDLVEQECRDPRVRVLRRTENGGVGAATITGYRQALADGADVIVKLDGDGQMDPAMIPSFVAPVLQGDADYAKGNRFYHLGTLRAMPVLRLIGNSVLSFMTKLSSGYWDLFDPTNGFTAIHARVVEELPLERISCGYFFESDMLFRLSIMRAVVADVPMHARYGSEASGLQPARVWRLFAARNFTNFLRRVGYNYFLRDFNFASIQLILGGALLGVGTAVGVRAWVRSAVTGSPATSGTVMLAALPVILGMQMFLAFLSHDLRSMPQRVLHRRLPSALRRCTDSRGAEERDQGG
jgi:dolichol-phosphate mannosyltransferase